MRQLVLCNVGGRTLPQQALRQREEFCALNSLPCLLQQFQTPPCLEYFQTIDFTRYIRLRLNFGPR